MSTRTDRREPVSKASFDEPTPSFWFLSVPDATFCDWPARWDFAGWMVGVQTSPIQVAVLHQYPLSLAGSAALMMLAARLDVTSSIQAQANATTSGVLPALEESTMIETQHDTTPDTAAPRAQQSGVACTDLQRHDLSVPAREVIQVRVDFAPGVVAPRHSHPGEEIVYALDGTLRYQLEGQPPVTIAAGEVVFIPPGTIHAVTNVGNGNAAELATYVVEKGKPLVVLAE
jgi:quercetin dioxygenase-like cupin family protein